MNTKVSAQVFFTVEVVVDDLYGAGLCLESYRDSAVRQATRVIEKALAAAEKPSHIIGKVRAEVVTFDFGEVGP